MRFYYFPMIFFGTTSQEQLLLDQKDELLSAQTQLRRQMGALLEAHPVGVCLRGVGIFHKRMYKWV